jgi:hypothetical protein
MNLPATSGLPRMEGTEQVRRLNALPFLISLASTLEAHMGDRVVGEHPDTLAVEPGSVRRTRLLHLQRGCGTVAVVDPYSRLVGNPYLGITSGLPVIRPQLGSVDSPPVPVDECLGDLSPTEAGIRVGEQLMGVECPVWPFLVNLPA